MNGDYEDTTVSQSSSYHSCQLVEKKSRDNLFSDNFAYTVNNSIYNSSMH